MPSSTSSSSLSPGTLLAGRYRIEDHVVDVATTSYWRAVDETLGRDVGVRTVAAADPLAATLTAAARTAASSHDPRFVRVLDVSTDRGQVFVVSEWARGRTRSRSCSPPVRCPTATPLHLVHEVAEALATAHRQHLRHRLPAPRLRGRHRRRAGQAGRADCRRHRRGAARGRPGRRPPSRTPRGAVGCCSPR